jgi:hypothetical protein
LLRQRENIILHLIFFIQYLHQTNVGAQQIYYNAIPSILLNFNFISSNSTMQYPKDGLKIIHPT